MQEIEPAQGVPVLSPAQTFSWEGFNLAGGAADEGVAAVTLDALGGTAARLLGKGTPYAEQSRRSRRTYALCKRA
ncbi:MAG TPA: hypothetical protein VG148_07210, partial [Pyrinomonadaceae bacterium]|nr:hypothetical protein [Pyrinomonadaceae bacterium]